MKNIEEVAGPVETDDKEPKFKNRYRNMLASASRRDQRIRLIKELLTEFPTLGLRRLKIAIKLAQIEAFTLKVVGNRVLELVRAFIKSRYGLAPRNDYLYALRPLPILGIMYTPSAGPSDPDLPVSVIIT